jgi:hypothetical protein
MAAKLCTDCGTRRQSTEVIGPELCDVCLRYWEDVNTHSDYGHDADSDVVSDEYDATNARVNGCPVCYPQLDHRYTKKAGHTNTVAKTRTSHQGHDHPHTPAARAMCRKSMKADN